MLTVHHLNNSRSHRVLWLLEELGLTYEMVRYERDRRTLLAPPELKSVHPLGKSPVLTDDGSTFAETGAIIEYILDRHGAGRFSPPHGTPDYWRFRYWLHYAEGSAMPPLTMKLVFQRMPTNAPALLRGFVGLVSSRVQAAFIDPQLQTHFDFWEAELGQSGWFAGPEFTAADIMMSYPVEAAANRANALSGRPRLSAFLSKIQSRPAYRKAVEKGGPYEYVIRP